MKKSDLKDLMVVEVRNQEPGENRYIVMGENLVRSDGWNKLEYYKKDLINKTFAHLDIIKVYNIVSFNTGLNLLLRDENLELIWEREEMPILTYDEKAVLRTLDKKWKYIARDGLHENDELYLFEEKPIRLEAYYLLEGGGQRLFDFYNRAFQSIQFESGPLLIEDLLNESSD